jgi:N-acetylglucosamine-6-sulfatase
VLRIALAATAICAAFPAAAAARSRPTSPDARQRPNFLLILVDDQATNTFEPKLMPDTFRGIVRRGTEFIDGLAAPPLCCPDRAGILTGQYPHNNGVSSNSPGYPSLAQKGDVLPVWLERAGYRTALIGKFLNNYHSVGGYRPAPGFDFWFAYDGLPRYFDYTMSDEGKPRFFGSRVRDYSTHVYTRQALRFIRARGRGPFFLWLAYNAPHVTRFPARHHRHCDRLDPVPPTEAAYRRAARVPLPQPPSFDEPDVSDKPRAIASLPAIDTPHFGFLTRRYRCTIAAMAAVDRGVGRVMRVLRRRRELRRTIVLYLSDNGFFFGEHRIQFNKSYPYEPALRVPFAVRVPAAYRRGASPRVSERVVSEQDIAPTLLDYAGGVRPCASETNCRRIDGRSLRPLLGGGGRWPTDRGVLAELNEPVRYSAIRTRRYLYARYADGERELYDLRSDPFELQNRASDPAFLGAEKALSRRLAALRRCSGHKGRRPCE